MLELATYRYVVVEMLRKVGFDVNTDADGIPTIEVIELAIRRGRINKISARECATKITRGEA